MKLFELPEIVRDAILSSAVGVAVRLEDHEFNHFWNNVLGSDYVDPKKDAPVKEAVVKPISPLTTTGYVPDPK